MADNERLVKALKDLPLRIQISSVKTRQNVIENVIDVLEHPGITENVIKGICRTIQLTLLRYHNGPSQLLIRNLIVALIKYHPKWAIKGLLSMLTDVVSSYRSLVITPNVSKTALVALNWSCITIVDGWKTDKQLIEEEITTLVDIQSVLFTCIESAGVSKYSLKAYNKLHNSWIAVPNLAKLYIETVCKCEPSYFIPVFTCALIKHFSSNVDILRECVDKNLDTFIKTLVSCKTKPLNTVIRACYPLLKMVNHEQFKNILLPALQKAMLRNPEVIVECVGLVVAGVTIDLSQYASDIGKGLIVNLHSKDDLTRRGAVHACKLLAQQCSDSGAVESLVKQVFAVFHGSDGKLTVLEQKLSVLEGSGNLSYNTVSGSSLQHLIIQVVNEFVKVLEIEVHEKTLCYALDMLSLWIAKISNDVPKKLIDAFKNGMTMKTSTASVRISYIQCMLVCFNSKLTSQASVLVPTLQKSLERGISQPTQASSVTEGLCAALLLIKIAESGEDKENKYSNLWTTLFDMEKQIFVSEKFLTIATEDSLIYVMYMCEHLLLEYPERLNGKAGPLYRAILICLTSASSNTRNKCLPCVRRIVSGLGGSVLAQALLKDLLKFLEVKLQNDSSEHNDSLSARIFIDCIQVLCSGTGTADEIAAVALNALLPCHFPTIGAVLPNLWIKILKRSKINPKEFVAQQAQILKKMLIDDYIPVAYYENALATVVKVNGDEMLTYLIQLVKKILSNVKIVQITKDEYFTYLTPEGELYDKSVMPEDQKDTAMNMKRESKAYSYKDQLEEMQLRRELEEKKKKEGKIKAPQYTAKQLEAIKNQKFKEQTIRDQLTELNADITTCVSMIRSAVKGNPNELSLFFKDILPLILRNVHSPLAAPYVTKLYVDLHKIVFEKNCQSLGELVAHVTLRLLKPHCDLDSAWEQEDLTDAAVRALNLIHVFVKKNDGEKVCARHHFTVPAFTYCFQMIKLMMLSSYAKQDEVLIQMSLQVISEHAKLRDTTNHEIGFYHPKYLPRQQMFELLIELINTTHGRIQSLAVACLLDVAISASGEENCAKASLDELDVLLTALQNPKDVVRDSALRGLFYMISSIPSFNENYEVSLKFNKRVWIARFDACEENKDLADKLWEQAHLEFSSSLCEELMPDIQHPVECIQVSAAKSLGALIKDDRKQIQPIVERLLSIYKEALQIIPPKLDEFGRELEKPIDTWGPRRGVAVALAELAPYLDPNAIGKLIEFFVPSALGDRQEEVRKEMLAAALNIVELHGKDHVSTLLPVFENFMDKSSKSAHFDAVKQAVVILMGSLAKHLEKDDPRIKPIVKRLISALSTPSQTVQEAVANCLPHLVPSVKEEAPGLVGKLLYQLLKSDKYGDRKGAAYGLAGLVKGMGILALKQLDIMTKLTEAIQDKKHYKHREGAVFAFEMLCQMLGRLFEPYIVHVLPYLLLCFGDSSQYVRSATDDCARVIMSKLSAHGVKLVLPSLLAALDEGSWRTKTGSVELLGAMAYCAPKQLSSCLPSIVPKLIEVLSDSHMKVQEAGAEALRVIGSVIRNPEIQAIVPVLLQALQDPSNKTSVCLQTLLDTQFVHFIDAPSLALIMPVVQRAFIDRSTETRKMAAQIIGNMYSLTDQKDLFPYLPTIIPGLKTSLLDPVPEVRSVSARALGAMVRGMGESSFEELLPWLMQTLTSESSSVDRSGAAQGLSEVVGGLGVEKLHKLMPEIIATAERTDIAPHVKDGYIMMFIYMPVVFQQDFTPYIGQIINPILKALADENEYVRDTALKAGQRIVNLYADSAILLLLPELERGLFDDNWRIRYSSVQLLGDLLYRISGVTGKMSTETASDDDNFGTEQSHQAIINSLGAERRNRVLAGLYMGRSDVALMVRQSALHVWKVVVTNTPKTLREILPTLFGLLLGCLASESYDKRQVAARTLGDLVRKLGERVLPEIIPILERGLQSDQSDQRQGVCIGLSEIMASTSREMVLTFVNSLVPTVRKALCDPLPEVRQAAAKTFDSLHSTVGARALDDILPTMLNKLNDDDPEVVEWTLDGLRQVMAIKSRVVLPYLVPQLTSPPANTRALSILASVAGEALNKYLPRILPALQTALASSKGTPDEAQQLEYCQAVVLSVMDEAGIRTIIDTLLENTRTENIGQRRAAATLLCAFCANSRAQYTNHVPQLFRGLIHLGTDSDKDVLQMSWEALGAVTKTLEPKQQASYVSDVRQAVRFAMSDMKGTSDLLPGFCLPKGIAPILPIFREAILNGDGDEKEAAAQGLGEVIKITSAQALQPSVVTITGPLIRILGDRFSANVKSAVLEALAILLAKVGVMLKQFLPQLQTTFVKALNDSNRTVRLKSAAALSYLILIHQRADPLFTELHNTIKNTDDPSIRETTLHALRGIVSPAGNKMSEAVEKQIFATLISLLGHQEDVTRNVAAGCFGALCKWLTPTQLDNVLNEHILNDELHLDWLLRQGRAAALSVTLKESANILWDEQYQARLIRTLLSQLSADRVPITQTAVRSCGYLLQYLMLNNEQLPTNLLVPFVKTMNNNSNDVKQLLAKVSIHLARTVPSDKMAPELLKLLLPALVNGTKEKNSYVKANSEIALIAVLRLKEGDEMHQKCLNVLDVGARESLSDVVSKVLRKIMNQPEGKEEDLDDTLLT
ncbi:hypothetical protein RN001_012230 [Aquatica leii]|uniref:TOG domain-containing protein n=1 Tax=Aquatica leii TaxID=1421715 RepID=A0AAN7QEN9_9COLE|nr:hypothetical protein RN001_012230 [Aquatica leii]